MIFEEIAKKANLNENERQLLRYMMDHIEELPFLSSRELARRNYMSSTAVLRCIKKIGFENYNDFKLNIRSYLKNYNGKETKVSENDELLELMNKMTQLNEQIYQACLDAFLSGYRHIDTAAYYENESFVGAAVRDCKIPREEIFVTSKLWYEDMVEGKQEAAIEKTLKELDLEYLDMYLLHWPINDVAGSWKVLEKYYEQGLIKNIGVSNFRPKHLKQLELTANVVPVVDQIEVCPFLVQNETINYCKERIIENADIFAFELSKEDMQIVESMDLRKSTGRGYPAEYEY